VRDELARNFESRTLPTDDLDVRVYIGSGPLVRTFAIFVALEGDVVEAFAIRIDPYHSDDADRAS